MDKALHAQDQRQGRAARADAAAGVGLRQGVHQLTPENCSTQALPRALQSLATPCWHRRQDTCVTPPRLETICLASTARGTLPPPCCTSCWPCCVSSRGPTNASPG